MSRLVETICLKDGKLLNIFYHNKRFNETRKILFDRKDFLNLKEVVKIEDKYSCGTYKVRVIYTSEIEEIEFLPYNFQQKKTLKILHCDEIEYSFKYEDRTKLDSLFKNRGECDDILIVKNGFITDSHSANVVFFDGEKWITPSTPLLKGTKRQYLIDNGIIREEELKLKDLRFFKGFYLVNAFFDLKPEFYNPITNIREYYA